MSTKRWNRRLTFKQPSTTVNSLNEVTGDASKYMERWGKLMDSTGNETTFGDQMQHIGSLKIETSYPRQGRFPQPEDIVTWTEWGTTRTVNIKHVERKNDGNRTIHLLCAEV